MVMLQLPSQQSESSSQRPLFLHAWQVKASQRPLEQSELVVQKEPFEHLPQSSLHSRPEFELPQISVPLQLPSPQKGGGFAQIRPAQKPLWQSLPLVHDEPFEHFPQSVLHLSPELLPPQSSVPSHWSSPQDWAHTPMQFPL